MIYLHNNIYFEKFPKIQYNVLHLILDNFVRANADALDIIKLIKERLNINNISITQIYDVLTDIKWHISHYYKGKYLIKKLDESIENKKNPVDELLFTYLEENKFSC